MKFKQRFNGMPELKKRLNNIKNAKTQIGWWAEQQHGTISSPQLAAILHNGADLKGGQPYLINDKDELVFLRKDSPLGQKILKAKQTGGAAKKTAQNGKQSEIKAVGITKPGHIPARPFFTVAAEQNRDKWINTDAKGLVKGVVKGYVKLEKALKLLGEAVKADVQEVMGKADNFIPNSHLTIKRKGKNTPLIDTNQLRQQMTVKVINK